MKVKSSYIDSTSIDLRLLVKIQVYLPAINGHVPPQMVRAVSSFMEFCYLIHHSVIDEDGLVAIDAAVARFHHEREIFNVRCH